jgi:membrane protease YdiL (CAAX protease family)
MKNVLTDLHIIIGIILAHLLLFFSFQDRAIFWYIFSGSILILIIFAILQENVDDKASLSKYLILGIMSGALIYALFWMGYHFLAILNIPLNKSIGKLYRWFAPSLFWHYLALFLIAAPGEELFWRGFIQKRLAKYLKPVWSIVAGALLYASANSYAGSFLLVLASFISGMVWGFLYWWKRSMPLVIVSHITFDIMIFIILPLR